MNTSKSNGALEPRKDDEVKLVIDGCLLPLDGVIAPLRRRTGVPLGCIILCKSRK